MNGHGKPRGDAFEREWRARFEGFARKHQDDAGIAGWSGTGLDARVRRFLTLWPTRNRAGERWLDAGCGAGTYSRILESSGAETVGLDYSYAALRHARARIPAARFIVGDVTRLPLAPASIDGILCFGVTQAVSSTRSVVQELARVTKPGAEIWIDGLNRWSLPSAADTVARFLKRKKRHLRYERPGRVCRDLAEVGTTGVELHWLPLAPSSLPWVQRWFEKPAVLALFRAVRPLAALMSHSFIVSARRAGA